MTIVDKLMYIPNDVTQKCSFCITINGWWLKCLDTQLFKPSNQNSIKVPKVVIPTNKKTLLYNFGDQGKQKLQ